MSLQDMTADQVIASIHNALEQELQKKHPVNPAYHSGHIALAYKLGKNETEERILDMLRRWDSTPADGDNSEYSLKIFDEMHRAFTIGFDYGEEAKEERIIKLLKDNIGSIEALEYDYFADELAELIKGENK